MPASAAAALMPFVMMVVVVGVAPAVLAPIAESVGMTVDAVSVSVLHAVPIYISIYLKSSYIEITIS